ncbi:MAG: flavin reductase family protein [Candidatus Caldarchaeum sp.]
MTDLREFMRRVPQCVTVVSTFHAGAPHGMTVSSFTSVSLEPPLILVALEKSATTCRVILESKRFAVNLLGQKQSSLSDSFAYLGHYERFTKTKYKIEKNVYPVLEGVIGVLMCVLESVYEAGDHLLLIGRVEEAKICSDELPLVYVYRQYYTVKPITGSA